MASNSIWQDRRHKEYEAARKRRKYARDHFTGAAQDIAYAHARRMAQFDTLLNARELTNEPDPSTVARVSDGITDFWLSVANAEYLHPRSQGEAPLAFYERTKITRFPEHMATLVESFVGGVFSVDGKAERTYGSILGNPEDQDSVIARMYRDIDGTGTNWDTRLIARAKDLIVDGEVWYLADRETARDPIRIYMIDPDSVVQWREEDGLVVEVLVHESTTEQATLEEDPKDVEFYTHYTLDGWVRYRIVDDGENSRRAAPEDAGQWAMPFYTSPDRRRMRLPFGRVKLPVDRPIGYQMARDANQLWNLLSDVRWLYRVLNHPRLNGNCTDEEWNATMDHIRRGGNATQGDWKYISPPAENASGGYTTYNQEVREYYISNHQRANQSAIERSATEILYNEAAGRTAFLSLLAGAIDEIENDWLFLAAQWEAPTRPGAWLEASVKRSRDFRPLDVERIADQRATRFVQYADLLPTDLALELSGHEENQVEAYRTYNPVGLDNGTRPEFPEDASFSQAQGEGDGMEPGTDQPPLLDLATGLGGVS